jgi:hypothetical protein
VGVSRPRRLQLDEHIEFVEKSWRVERVATWVLVAILIAAVAGLLGSGPLSGGEASTGRLRVEYPRLSRFQSSERLVIHAAPARAGELRLWLDRAYLEGVRIETMVPPPLRAETAGDRVIFVFMVADGASPFALHVRLQPERIGVLHGRVGLDGAGEALAFRQLVYP